MIRASGTSQILRTKFTTTLSTSKIRWIRWFIRSSSTWHRKPVSSLPSSKKPNLTILVPVLFYVRSVDSPKFTTCIKLFLKILPLNDITLQMVWLIKRPHLILKPTSLALIFPWTCLKSFSCSLAIFPLILLGNLLNTFSRTCPLIPVLPSQTARLRILTLSFRL